MKRLTIYLRIDGKNKRFRAPEFVSSEAFFRVLKLKQDLEAKQDFLVVYEQFFPLICEVFANQFTVEQIRKGVDAREAMNLVNLVADHVIDRMEMYYGNDEGGGVVEGN